MQVYSPSPDFTPLYSLINFTKCQKIRRYWGRSVLQLELPITYDVVSFLQKNCWIVDEENDNEPYIIRNIRQNETLVTVTAYGAHWGFEGRITIPEDGEYAIEAEGSADTVVKEFINSTLTGNRGLNITTDPPKPLKDNEIAISDQTRYKNLGDEIVRILNASGRGEKFRFDFEDSIITFDTYKGDDKSECCVFDVMYKNIDKYEYTLDATSTQTTPIVGAAGEGAAQDFEIAGTDISGWDRREVYVDARDVDKLETEKLKERASQAVVTEEKEYTVKASTNANLIYNTHYKLGDYVTMNVPIKIYREVDGHFEAIETIERMKTRIIEVIETYEGDSKTIELTVGDNVIKSEITQIKSDISQLKSIDSAFPAGFIMLYAGSVPPKGYLMANGQVVSRTKYSDLFAAIGTTYGSGDGSTTFNVPNMSQANLPYTTLNYIIKY